MIGLGFAILLAAILWNRFGPGPVDSEDYGWAIGASLISLTSIVLAWLLLGVGTFGLLLVLIRDEASRSLVALLVVVAGVASFAVLSWLLAPHAFTW
jgi:hypothetical protein